MSGVCFSIVISIIYWVVLFVSYCRYIDEDFCCVFKNFGLKRYRCVLKQMLLEFLLVIIYEEKRKF